MHKAIIYGKSRTAYGVRMDGACLRLVLDGGGAYLYGVPSEPSGPVRMAEIPVKAEELEGGDIVTYADGKGYRVGGALVSWTPEDAAFAVAMRAEPSPPKPKRPKRPDRKAEDRRIMRAVNAARVAGSPSPHVDAARELGVDVREVRKASERDRKRREKMPHAGGRKM